MPTPTKLATLKNEIDDTLEGLPGTDEFETKKPKKRKRKSPKKQRPEMRAPENDFDRAPMTKKSGDDLNKSQEGKVVAPGKQVSVSKAAELEEAQPTREEPEKPDLTTAEKPRKRRRKKSPKKQRQSTED